MTIDITVEKHGLRVTMLIVTANVETHSALQELPPNVIEQYRQVLKSNLEFLLKDASSVAKK